MDALQFGNYGAYVWASFALTFVVVLVVDLRARSRHRQVYKEIEVRIKAIEDRQ